VPYYTDCVVVYQCAMIHRLYCGVSVFHNTQTVLRRINWHNTQTVLSCIKLS